tara:strand:+ start:874 stop:1293 length:420 start_codon:yes stop_codon:yes gene_type:complete
MSQAQAESAMMQQEAMRQQAAAQQQQAQMEAQIHNTVVQVAAGIYQELVGEFIRMNNPLDRVEMEIYRQMSLESKAAAQAFTEAFGMLKVLKDPRDRDHQQAEQGSADQPGAPVAEDDDTPAESDDPRSEGSPLILGTE